MSGLFEKLRGKRGPEVIDVDAMVREPQAAAPRVRSACRHAWALTPWCQDAGADGAPAKKQARAAERSEGYTHANKFEDDEVFRRVRPSSQGGGVRVELPSLAPSAFYGGVASAVASAKRGLAALTVRHAERAPAGARRRLA